MLTERCPCFGSARSAADDRDQARLRHRHVWRVHGAPGQRGRARSCQTDVTGRSATGLPAPSMTVSRSLLAVWRCNCPATRAPSNQYDGRAFKEGFCCGRLQRHGYQDPRRKRLIRTSLPGFPGNQLQRNARFVFHYFPISIFRRG